MSHRVLTRHGVLQQSLGSGDCCGRAGAGYPAPGGANLSVNPIEQGKGNRKQRAMHQVHERHQSCVQEVFNLTWVFRPTVHPFDQLQLSKSCLANISAARAASSALRFLSVKICRKHLETTWILHVFPIKRVENLQKNTWAHPIEINQEGDER